MDTITSPLVNSLNVYDHLIIRHFQLEWAGSVDQQNTSSLGSFEGLIPWLSGLAGNA